MKKQLANVAFGGAWSEGILTRHEADEICRVLDDAVALCGEQDMRTPELETMLMQVEASIEKGFDLATGFRSALDLQEPGLRQMNAARYRDQIKRWIGQ